MHPVGRLLRTLRIATGLSLTDAAVSTELREDRLRELESGFAPLGYGEGLVLAKTYLMCSTCFARHYRAAQARAGIHVEPPSDDPA